MTNTAAAKTVAPKQASRYASIPVWQAKKIDTTHRGALMASASVDVSDDWLDDLLEGEEA